MKITTQPHVPLRLLIGNQVEVQGSPAEIIDVLTGEGASQFQISKLISQCSEITEETARLNSIVARVLEQARDDKQTTVEEKAELPDWVKDLGNNCERLTEFLIHNNLWTAFEGQTAPEIAIKAIADLLEKNTSWKSVAEKWRTQFDELSEKSNQTINDLRAEIERLTVAPIEPQVSLKESPASAPESPDDETPVSATNDVPEPTGAQSNGKTAAYDPAWQKPDGSLFRMTPGQIAKLTPAQLTARKKEAKRLENAKTRARIKALKATAKATSNGHLNGHGAPSVVEESDGDIEVSDDFFEARKRAHERKGTKS
jgi:hypothetical protein